MHAIDDVNFNYDIFWISDFSPTFSYSESYSYWVKFCDNGINSLHFISVLTEKVQNVTVCRVYRIYRTVKNRTILYCTVRYRTGEV